MRFMAEVYEAMYEYNDKKYLRVVVPEKMADVIAKIQMSSSRFIQNRNVENPLDGRILKIKIPFRYRRVMCNVEGRPIQSLIKGDVIDVNVDFKGVWNVENHSGFSWVLSSSTFSGSSDA